MKFVLRVNGETKGPFALSMIREMLAAGVIDGTTLMAHEGAGYWQHVAKYLSMATNQDESLIEFHCPNCNARISAESEFAGQDATCPTCGQGMVVPALPQMVPRAAGIPHHASPEAGQGGYPTSRTPAGPGARTLPGAQQGRKKSNNTMKTLMTTVAGVVIMGCVVFGMIYSHGGRSGNVSQLAELHSTTARAPFINSLGMQFVPVNIPTGPSKGASVMFSVWETRRQDYAAYAKDVAGVNESWKNTKYASEETAPVIFVNSNDALSFCKWLTLKEKKTGIIPANAEYRLPTDYEWSCAVGIGDKEVWNESLEQKNKKIKNVYPWGSAWPPPTKYVEFYTKNYTVGKTYKNNTPIPVGKFAANKLGIFDMECSVSEICMPENNKEIDRGSANSNWFEAVRFLSHPDELEDEYKKDYISGFLSSSRLIIDECSESTLKFTNYLRTSDSGFRCVLVADSKGQAKHQQQTRAAKIPQKPPVTNLQKAADLSGFVLIPGGEFTMGDALDGFTNAPQHKVNVSAFYMQKKEVSKAEWDEVRAWGVKNGYTDLPEGKGKAADHPVHSITWYDMVKWCNARSVKEGLIPCYYTDAAQATVYRTDKTDLASTMVKWSAKGYRLPTEAEWEKAARGGLIGKRFPWGDTISHEWANFRNNGKEAFQNGTTGYHPTYNDGVFPSTSPVGSFAPNGYGLYDMAGNVGEWCWDRYGDYPSALLTDPQGATSGASRVLRGGVWLISASYCRVAGRFGGDPPGHEGIIGFRIARSSPP